MSNSITKEIHIKASQSRVWRALTDYREFGEWFGLKLEGPILAGHEMRGAMSACGHDNLILTAKVIEVTPETRFVYTWHPFAVDPTIDYSVETPTVVEMVLATDGNYTRLMVTETGFDHIPEHRKSEALKMNTQGWEIQLGNIARYVEG